VNNAVRDRPPVNYRAYILCPYNPQSQYFEYVNIWDLTVQKILHNIQAAAARSVIAADAASETAST
jgi:hypothetical protein